MTSEPTGSGPQRRPASAALRGLLLAALLAGPALMAPLGADAAPPGDGTAGRRAVQTAATAPLPAQVCTVWPAPEDPAGLARVAVLVIGAIAIARGVYAVFRGDRDPGAPIAGSL